MLQEQTTIESGIIDCGDGGLQDLSMQNLSLQMHTIQMTLKDIKNSKLEHHMSILSRLDRSIEFLSSSQPYSDPTKHRNKNLMLCISAFAERDSRHARFANTLTAEDLNKLLQKVYTKLTIVRHHFRLHNTQHISEDTISELNDFFAVIEDYLAKEYPVPAGCW